MSIVSNNQAENEITEVTEVLSHLQNADSSNPTIYRQVTSFPNTNLNRKPQMRTINTMITSVCKKITEINSLIEEMDIKEAQKYLVLLEYDNIGRGNLRGDV